MNWPARSPDMNPIEPALKALKIIGRYRHPAPRNVEIAGPAYFKCGQTNAFLIRVPGGKIRYKCCKVFDYLNITHKLKCKIGYYNSRNMFLKKYLNLDNY